MSTTKPRNGSAGTRHARRLFALLLGVSALVVLFVSASAQAAVSDPWTNPSFNTGNLNAWQASGTVVNDRTDPVSLQDPVQIMSTYDKNYRTPDPGRKFGYQPPTWLDSTVGGGPGAVGSYYALVLGGCNGTHDLDPPGSSTLSRSFTANAGDVLSGYSFFKSEDYFNDSGTVQILDSNGNVVQVVFHSDQATIGTYMGTAWTAWSYTFPQSGTYTLQVVSTSATDCEAPSAVGLDLPTPNPLKMGQTISYAPPVHTYGDSDFDLGATSTSGNPVALSSNTPTICTIVGGQVHIAGAGNCRLTASVNGNEDYAPKTQGISFNIGKAPLYVNADDQGKAYGAADPSFTYGLSGFVNGEDRNSANVGGDASCAIADGTGSDVGSYPNAITCAPGTLAASNYNVQTGFPGTLTIGKADQSIDLPAQPDKDTLDGDFDPGATASSGLPVSYSTSTPSVCTIGGGQVHIAGAGTCTITASQSGNGNYNPAQDVSRTFNVSKVGQSIDFPSLASMTYGDGDVDPGATASSGLPVTYSTSTPSVCTIVGGKLHVVSSGSCSITASQGGNGTYSAANDATQTLNVAKADQTIALNGPSGKDFSSPDFDLGATASSALAVSYSSSTPGVCTIVGGKVHVVGAGDCTITASQVGNDRYNAAQDQSVTFAIAKAPQSISFAAPQDRYTVAPDFDPGATASSGLGVSYSSSTPGVCTVVAGKVHIAGVGTCSVTASQAGNGNYQAAQDVTRTFAVTRPTEPPTVSIAAAADGATYFQYQTIRANYSCQAAQGVSLTSCAGDANVGSPIDTSTPGAHSFTVTAQDAAGNQARKTVTYNVIAVGTVSGGAFVIGDRNADVGSQVTFWGSKWAKQNSLSRGPAPDSFKGFADSALPGNPLSWGSFWTTRPGNSSNPPNSVPPYMAVIVSSSIQKSGPTIGGDIPRVVVVKTNSGYDDNPGHAGTGTVVAQLGG
jgi:hypothetical protein